MKSAGPAPGQRNRADRDGQFPRFPDAEAGFPAPGSGCFSTVFPRLHGLTGKNKLNFIPGQAGSADYFIHALTFPVAVEDNLARK